MLLIWLLCSALMTLRVGPKQGQADTPSAAPQKMPEQAGPSERVARLDVPERAGLVDPVRATAAESMETAGARPL